MTRAPAAAAPSPPLSQVSVWGDVGKQMTVSSAFFFSPQLYLAFILLACLSLNLHREFSSYLRHSFSKDAEFFLLKAQLVAFRSLQRWALKGHRPAQELEKSFCKAQLICIHLLSIQHPHLRGVCTLAWLKVGAGVSLMSH